MEPWVLAFASALFSIMNPIGNAGIYASMIPNMSDAESRKIAWKCACAVVIILLISTWAGAWFLKLAGINVHELRAAGGLIVLLIGLRMLFNDTSHAQTESEAEEALEQDSIAVVPLAIPIIAGPGTISLVIATAGQNGGFESHVTISAICVLFAGVIGVVFSFAKKMSALIGANGMAVVTRVMGMILASIAMGMLASGVRGLFPEVF
ncbi:MAG: MarC family protein [Akkermansiaceae bacterium]